MRVAKSRDYRVHNNLVPRALFPGFGGGADKGTFWFFYLCCILCFFVVDSEQSTFTLKIRRVRRLIMSERVGTKNALSQKETGARRVVGTWNVQVKSFSFPEMRWSPQFTFWLFLNSIYFPVWHYLANSWSYFIFYKLKSGGGCRSGRKIVPRSLDCTSLRGNVKVDPRPSLAYSRFCLVKHRSSQRGEERCIQTDRRVDARGEKRRKGLLFPSRVPLAQPVKKLPMPATPATTSETTLNQKMEWFEGPS